MGDGGSFGWKTSSPPRKFLRSEPPRRRGPAWHVTCSRGTVFALCACARQGGRRSSAQGGRAGPNKEGGGAGAAALRVRWWGLQHWRGKS